MSEVLGILIPVFSTIATAAILFAIRFLWTSTKKMFNEGREEQVQYLKRIEAQATLTNGRVTTVEKDLHMIRERLSHDEGQIEVLLREKGQPT